MKPADMTHSLFMADLIALARRRYLEDNATVTPFLLRGMGAGGMEFELRITSIDGHQLPATEGNSQ